MSSDFNLASSQRAFGVPGGFCRPHISRALSSLGRSQRPRVNGSRHRRITATQARWAHDLDLSLARNVSVGTESFCCVEWFVAPFNIGRTMRIAQVAPLAESVPPKLYGGTERVVSWLTEELVSLGHDVTLFATGDSVTSAQIVPVGRGRFD